MYNALLMDERHFDIVKLGVMKLLFQAVHFTHETRQAMFLTILLRVNHPSGFVSVQLETRLP